jgi:hypothetical protein
MEEKSKWNRTLFHAVREQGLDGRQHGFEVVAPGERLGGEEEGRVRVSRHRDSIGIAFAPGRQKRKEKNKGAKIPNDVVVTGYFGKQLAFAFLLQHFFCLFDTLKVTSE